MRHSEQATQLYFEALEEPIMTITRRDILKATGAAVAASAVPSLAAAEEAVAPLAEDGRRAADSDRAKRTRDPVQDVWGDRTPYYQQWPDRVDARIVEQPDRWVQSTCILCSSGCGMDVGVKDGRIVAVRGREVDRVNHGRLGPKGLYGWEANHSPDRLRKPLIRTSQGFKEASWDEAMNIIVERSKQLINQGLRSAIGFYTSGQLFIEEYYTLSTLAKAGIGTPNVDGNTRLCTATNVAALRESFGTDGNPASYTDIDVTDTLFLVGHNIAETQTVLWMRMLDRLAGPHRPKLIVVDPRKTPTAREADVHIQCHIGSNVPVLNGLLHLIIKHGKLDHDFIAQHTVGFEHLEKIVAQWTPDRVEQVAGVPHRTLRAAADILGHTPSLLSTALQGVYQSMQATAAAVQINNVHLIRGLIGKPGSGVFQMNGQPTSQNTRECGADGTIPGNRNWDNPAHIRDLARVWNVSPDVIPYYKPPTHVLEMFHFLSEGSIKLFWISGTNPCVSLPELHRIRRILEKPDLLVVVQDAFMTETAKAADIVLPAALWGERTGCFTNVDRTVHISYKAIEPPGEAKSDLDIWLDYARRMDFKDLDGKPLIKWHDPESAFEAWKRCSAGRPCDYSALTYAKLTAGSGIQWPVTKDHPNGLERLYLKGDFNTDADYCESFGHDLLTGAAVEEEHYRANNPKGRAIIKPAEYQPPHEEPDKEYPFWITTGRVVYHWHTRTKTGRVKELQQAAPDCWVEMSPDDAKKLDLREGDYVHVASRRGIVEVRVRLTDIKPGNLFIPFHYGYWDDPGHPRAANELTITEWDAVSKQPAFKYAAVQVKKIGKPSAPQPDQEHAAVRAKEKMQEQETKHLFAGLPPGPGRHVASIVALQIANEQAMAKALRSVAEHHGNEPDIRSIASEMSKWSDQHVPVLQKLFERYRWEEHVGKPMTHEDLYSGPRKGGLGLVRDLQDLTILNQEIHLTYTELDQAAKVIGDMDMKRQIEDLGQENDRQRAWLKTRIKSAAVMGLNFG